MNIDHLPRNPHPFNFFAMMDVSSEKRDFMMWWDRLTFFTHCIAFLFMILFSVSAVQNWISPWNHISIFIACFLPLSLLIFGKAREGFMNLQIMPECLFIIAIFILGALNIIFSDNRNMSLHGMGLFLISGICPFLSTRLLCDSLRKLLLLSGFYAVIFIFICLFGFFEIFKGNQINIFSGNPIPAGSLIILLSIGPMIQAQRSRNNLTFYLWLSSLFVGVTLLIMIGKKGPFVALIFMAIFLLVFFYKNITKIYAISIATFLSAGFIILITKSNDLQKTLEGKKWAYSIYFRLENYFYGLHIFKKHPLVGIGFPSEIVNFYQDYQQYFSEKIQLREYTQFIEQINSLENMVLTMFVEMGGLMSGAYIMLILFCCLRLSQVIKKTPHRRTELGFLIAGLIGFFVHSMTYDSLRFPNLNWIFHSILGVILGYANFHLRTTESPKFFSQSQKTI